MSRLRGVLAQMDEGLVDLAELRRNLELAASVLEAVYVDESRWAQNKYNPQCREDPQRLHMLTTVCVCVSMLVRVCVCVRLCMCPHRRLLDTEDELSELQAESVPSEVRYWLASTFSRKLGVARRRPEEKPRFRSIVHAVQAGIFVER